MANPEVCCPRCSLGLNELIQEKLNVADAYYDKRLTELLAHNNELLERARAAERDVLAMREVARMAIIVAGEIAKQLPRPA